MAQQDRAVRTRRRIVEAAGAVFADLGYTGASTTEILARSGVTRGALYHHFPSKEAIANAVVEAQNEALVPPEHEIRLQAMINLTHGYTHRLRTDPMLRGAVRLAVEQGPYMTVVPYIGPQTVIAGLLEEAAAHGELLPTVRPVEAARLIVGSYTGIQLLSQAATGREDLGQQVSVLWQYLLPALSVPALLPHLQTTGT